MTNEVTRDDERSIHDLTEVEVKLAIAEITIKLHEQDEQKKRDNACHNDAIKEYKGERQRYLDELENRK